MKNVSKKVLIGISIVTWTLVIGLFIHLVVQFNRTPTTVERSVNYDMVPAEFVKVESRKVIEPVIPSVVQRSIDICKDDIAVEMAHAVNSASRKHHIPHEVIYAIIATESGRNRTEDIDYSNYMDVNYHAKSGYDCRGLMQVSKYALDDYNKYYDTLFTMEDLYDITFNIEIGTWYFSQFKSVATSYTEMYVIYNVGYGRYSKVNKNWFYGWDGNWYNNYHNSFFFMNDMYPPSESWTSGLYGKNKLEPYRPKQRFEKCLKLCEEHFSN